MENLCQQYVFMIIEDILQMEHNEKPNKYLMMSMVGLEVRRI